MAIGLTLDATGPKRQVWEPVIGKVRTNNRAEMVAEAPLPKVQITGAKVGVITPVGVGVGVEVGKVVGGKVGVDCVAHTVGVPNVGDGHNVWVGLVVAVGVNVGVIVLVLVIVAVGRVPVIVGVRVLVGVNVKVGVKLKVGVGGAANADAASTMNNNTIPMLVLTLPAPLLP